MTTTENIKIAGIAVRTTNENGLAQQEIPGLWNQFFAENILQKIPNRTNTLLYCIYTEYEKDHTMPYTTVLGCEVSSLNDLPDELIGIQIPQGKYKQIVLHGNPQEGIVFAEWQMIWKSDLRRTYKADFEIYDLSSPDPTQQTIRILVGVED